MDTKQGIILVGIGLLLLWASVETASAKTWYVNDDGGADFTKIQDAIHNASSGDTIIVYEGAYCENIAVPKSLTIVGEKISYLVASTYAYCVHITADNVTVKGFTVRNHKDGYGGFLIKDVNNCVIAENMIEIDRGSGFDISGGDNISVIDNVISVNRFSGLGADRITDSIIHSNSITGGGIFLYGSNYNEVSGNTISSTLWGAIGIGTYNSEGSCHNLISDNIIKNTTKEGISLGSGSNFNEVYNNTIDSSESGLGLSEISNYNIIKNNTVHARYVNFEDTYFNKIYQNNFIDCDVTDEGNTNSWDNGPIEGGNYWSDHNCTGNPSNGSQPYIIDEDSIDHYPFEDLNGWLFIGKNIFDTCAPANPYPSIMGNHTGTIKPNHTVIATKLYTYPCVGTGGHTEYARIGNKTWNATATWKGYASDWHNISFDKTVVLLANGEYNYTIQTGSYPQIIHRATLPTENGWINCTKFTDANGRIYTDWIPAIRLE